MMDKNNVINKSIEYILQHFDENISIKDVAGHMNFSEYYFSRLFKEKTGESLYAFMKRLKMEQSAIDMKLKKNKTITDIGWDYGYSSSNYSTAFLKYHHISPAQFRKNMNVQYAANPFHPERVEQFDKYEDYAAAIVIENIADMTVIYEKLLGDYYDIKERWLQFMDVYKDYYSAETLMVERFYDDPAIASRHNCICDLCITAEKSLGLPNMTTIKGGKFAVYRFSGIIPDIFRSVQGVFSVWLPESGYIMDERYGLNIYREADIMSGQVVMDICIPVK